MGQVAHQAGAYPGFCSMKLPGVFLLPLDGMLAITGLPSAFSLPVPVFYTWVVRGTVRVVSCPRTQCNVPSQDLNQDFRIQSQAH